MIIDCIADLHGHFPELSGGDLLIIAGDLTDNDDPHQHYRFYLWLMKQNYKLKIYIAGNHDKELQEDPKGLKEEEGIVYLEDSGTEFEGLKIWGSPWTLEFDGINPHCTAFTVKTEKELQKKWDLIPDDIDILITHMPPLYILDEIRITPKIGKKSVGSISLCRHTIRNKDPKKFPNLKLHVFGHIHECGGRIFEMPARTHVNASIVNEYYEPVNKPVRVEL